MHCTLIGVWSFSAGIGDWNSIAFIHLRKPIADFFFDVFGLNLMLGGKFIEHLLSVVSVQELPVMAWDGAFEGVQCRVDVVLCDSNGLLNLLLQLVDEGPLFLPFDQIHELAHGLIIQFPDHQGFFSRMRHFFLELLIISFNLIVQLYQPIFQPCLELCHFLQHLLYCLFFGGFCHRPVWCQQILYFLREKLLNALPFMTPMNVGAIITEQGLIMASLLIQTHIQDGLSMQVARLDSIYDGPFYRVGITATEHFITIIYSPYFS